MAVCYNDYEGEFWDEGDYLIFGVIADWGWMFFEPVLALGALYFVPNTWYSLEASVWGTETLHYKIKVNDETGFEGTFDAILIIGHGYCGLTEIAVTPGYPAYIDNYQVDTSDFATVTPTSLGRIKSSLR